MAKSSSDDMWLQAMAVQKQVVEKHLERLYGVHHYEGKQVCSSKDELLKQLRFRIVNSLAIELSGGN